MCLEQCALTMTMSTTIQWYTIQSEIKRYLPLGLVARCPCLTLGQSGTSSTVTSAPKESKLFPN